MKHGVETIVMLYDTYIGRPEIDIQVVYQTEKQIMNNTKAYFVPYHCKNEYLSYYDESSFICYKLPLFVEKEIVLDTYRSKKILYDFSYFGQLQTFRNPNEVHSIFKQLNITLNIFTSPIYNDDGTFVYHPTITEEDLFYSIVCSKFLVILDNNAPYEHYLPSKAILYASFTKPIIVFGKNNHSALLDFLQDYPYLYYHNLESPIDGFVEFLNKPHIDFFDEKVYQKYIDYLPKNALKVVTDLINSVSDINKSNKHTI